MKLYNKFLTLLAASSVFANTIPLNKRSDFNISLRKRNEFNIALHKRDDFNVSSECMAAIDKITREYDECSGISLDYINAENDCKIIKYDKCIKYYNFKFSETPGCTDADKPDLIKFEEMMKFGYLILKMDCLKDENGKQCPYNVLVELDNSFISWTDEEAMTYIKDYENEICKSKICANGFVDSLEEFRNIISQTNLNFLDSKEVKEVELTDKSIKRIIDVFKKYNCGAQSGSVAITETNNNQTANTQAGSTQTANTQLGNAQPGNAQAGNAQAGANQTTNTQPGTTQDGNGLATNNSTVNNQTATNNSTNTQTSAAVSGYKLSYTLVTTLVLVTLNLLL